MRAMLLAAGLGTRLRPLTEERPKAVVPVANRPLAAFALEHFARNGIDRVVINTHHLADEIEARLAPWVPEGLSVETVHEPAILGTGGGVKNAERWLVGDRDEPVLVMNADILFAPNLPGILATHRRLDPEATLVVRPNVDRETRGAIDAGPQGRVWGILGERPPGTRPADEDLRAFMFVGAQVLASRVIPELPGHGCIVRDSYQSWLSRGATLAAHVDWSPWRDAGTLQAYLETNLALASGTIAWPGIIPDPDGNLIAPEAEIGEGATLQAAIIGPGARIAPKVTINRSVVWDGATVEADISDAVVTPHRTLTPGPSPSP